MYECIEKNEGGVELKNGNMKVEFKNYFENKKMKEDWSWKKKKIKIKCMEEEINNE
jgi:hypothetical protein